MAKVLKYVLGMDNKNRFESFYSAGAPAQDFVRYSAVDNLDGHVTDEEFDVDFFRSRWHRDPKNAERGCMLSHLNMWRDFLASDADWALIAEDDIIISADAEPVVQNIITKYPQVQMVVLCDAFALEAGKMNPRVTYPRISLLSPFVYGKYRMGGKYSLTRLTGTGLYLISRSGAELLLKNFDKGTPGTVADDYPLYEEWGMDVRYVQPGLCDWEGSSLIEDLGIRHVETLYRGLQANNIIGRLRVLLAPKARLANAKNALLSTVEDVKRRLAR